VIQELSACDTSLGALGVATIQLEIDEVEIQHNFVILSKLANDCILGCEFLRTFTGIIDVTKQTLTIHLPRERIKSLRDEDEREV
jgi:hypothetical protein